MNYFFISVLALGLFAGCASSENKQEQEAPVSSAPVDAAPLESTARLAIYVKKDGTVLLNDQKTDLKALEEALKEHKLKGGTVFYSRDDQQQDPPEIAIQVMDLIAKQELPIQFYTDGTFKHIVQFQ